MVWMVVQVSWDLQGHRASLVKRVKSETVDFQDWME
jgi:hypothetical protein